MFFYFWCISLVRTSWHPQTISTVSNVKVMSWFSCGRRGNDPWNCKNVQNEWRNAVINIGTVKCTFGCMCVCWCTFLSVVQPLLCVSLNAKLPPINTVMSLHILNKQHDAPKTHYLRFQVCLLYRQTTLLRMGLLKNHCENIITLCEE